MSRAEVEFEGRMLEPGQTVRVVCPFCGGGSDNERCMAITRNADNGLILYICFRGHCGESGVIGDAGPLLYKRPTPAFHPYEPIDAIPLEAMRVPLWVRVMLKGWNLDLQDCRDWLYEVYEDRILMPVCGPLLELRGYVRRGPSDRKPKVLTGRVINDKPFQGWFIRPTPRRHLILVEDVPSAKRLYLNDADAVALTGCTPGDDAIEEIVSIAKKRGQILVWALDFDATSKAIKYSMRTQMRVPSQVAIIQRDIKDMTDEEIYECLLSVL